MILKTEHIAWN